MLGAARGLVGVSKGVREGKREVARDIWIDLKLPWQRCLGGMSGPRTRSRGVCTWDWGGLEQNTLFMYMIHEFRAVGIFPKGSKIRNSLQLVLFLECVKHLFLHHSFLLKSCSLFCREQIPARPQRYQEEVLEWASKGWILIWFHY